MGGGGKNDLRAGHSILKQAFLLKGSSSIYRGSAALPEGPACDLQPGVCLGGGTPADPRARGETLN